MKMKKTTLLLAALLLAAAPVFSQKKGAEKAAKKPVSTFMSLNDAVAKNLVRLSFAGPGGHSSLKLSIENPGAAVVKIHIPQGQLFDPENGGEQSLVVGEEQRLVISPKKVKEVELPTFCTESSDASPGKASKFVVGAMATEPVLKMLRFLAEKGRLKDGSAQGAVWSVCDGSGFSPAGIENDEVAAQACQILNRPRPNYRIRYETRNVAGQAGFEGKALVVNGNYTYFLAKDEKLSLTLFDPEGKAVKVLYKSKPASAGEHRASLHLEVMGLKQGTYSVKLTTESGEVVKEQEVEF